MAYNKDGFATFPVMKNVSLVARVTSDNIYHTEGTKTSFASINMVTNSRADSSKEAQLPFWFDVKVFGGYADFAKETVSKGDYLIVVGDLYIDYFESKTEVDEQDDPVKVPKFVIMATSIGKDNRWFGQADNRTGGNSNQSASSEEAQSTRRRPSVASAEAPAEGTRRRRPTAETAETAPAEGGSRRRRSVADAGDQ